MHHPMYIERKGNCLWQGDLIEARKLIKSGALDGHQDYIKTRQDFVGYCVITQTCDLLRDRKGIVSEPGANSKSKLREPVVFVHLAVIRRLTDFFLRVDAEGQRRDTAMDSLMKIISHNENKRGCYYLHPVH